MWWELRGDFSGGMGTGMRGNGGVFLGGVGLLGFLSIKWIRGGLSIYLFFSVLSFFLSFFLVHPRDVVPSIAVSSHLS